MALILDTNAFSAFADGDAALERALGGERDLALSAIVPGEFLFGIRAFAAATKAGCNPRSRSW